MSVLPVAPPKRGLEAVTAGSALLARDHLLPVGEPLSRLLPLGGLPRGSTTLVAPGRPGSTSLALELLAGLSAAGHWCAAVGLPDLGLVAASERGIVLGRLLLVPRPGPRWQQVLATLFDAVPSVLFSPESPVKPSDARKLAARARERASALVVLDRGGHWQEPTDLRFEVVSSSWSGLGQGHGLLAGRALEVELRGRGAAARPRRGAVLGEEADLHLPMVRP